MVRLHSPNSFVLAVALLGCARASEPAAVAQPVAAEEPGTPELPDSPPAQVDVDAPAPDDAEPEPEPEPPPVWSREQASVRPLHEGRVLITIEADPAWATGPVLMSEPNDYHEKWQLERAVELDALPPELRAYEGMAVDLYGPAGRKCQVTLERLTIEAHLPMADAGGYEAEPSDAELWAFLLAADGQEEVLLVASFAADRRCDGALWARDASLPGPNVLVLGKERDHAKLLKEEHRRALASEAGQKFERDYAAYAAEPEFAEDAEPWSSVSKGRRQVWVNEQGAAQLVTVDFGSHVFAPCRWQGPSFGVVRQLSTPDQSNRWDPAPVAVFDADLDGHYELLILRDGGDFTNISIVSMTPALGLTLTLPDNAHVWC